MAIGVTSLASKGNTDARSTYTCGPLARAPDANTLVIAAIQVSDGAGTPVEPTGVVSTSMVFSLITSSVSFNPTTPGSQLFNLSVWRSMSATPDSSTVTATFPNNATGCNILLAEFSGVSTSGTSGANAVGQSATSVLNVDNAFVVFGPSAASTANAWFAVHSADTIEIGDIHSSFLTVDTVGYTTPDGNIVSAFTTLASGSSCEFRASGTNDWGGVIVEIVADNPAVAGGDVFSPYYATYYYPQVVASC